MIASANEAFNLIPDWTLGVQTLIFLVVLGALSIFVFRPVLKIIEKRREFTTEAREEAAKLTEDARQLDIGRSEVLAIAISEAQADREKKLALAHRDADRLIADAREGTRQVLKSSEISVESAKRLLEQQSTARSEEIAGSIVERIMK